MAAFDKKKSMARRREILRLRDDEGLTFAEIGEILGCSRQNVHDLYHRSRRAIAPFKRRTIPWTKRKKEAVATTRRNARIKMMYSEGVRMKAIAEFFSLSTMMIYNIIKEYRDEMRRATGNPKWPKPADPPGWEPRRRKKK